MDTNQKLGAVIQALNNISVSGKSNLTNLSGAIVILEEIYKELTVEKTAGQK